MQATPPADAAAWLQRNYVVGWLDPHRIQALAALCTSRVFARGEALCRRGTPSDVWMLIQEGTARSVDAAPDTVVPPLDGAGDSFGARGLVDAMHWPATLRAESPVTALVCTLTAFTGFAASLTESEQLELRRRAALEDDLRLLRTLRVFAQLPASDVEGILDGAVRRRIARGGYVFREDEPSGCCYILRIGRVQLLKRVETSQKLLATRRAGDLVGEIELLYGTPRMADALAATDLDLFELPQATFDALIPDGRCREAIFQSATDRLLQYQNALAEADRRALQQLPALDVRWVKLRSHPLSRAYPVVDADTAAAAGVACLSMIDRFHQRESGWEAQLEQLLAAAEPETLASLSRKAEECGYLTRLLRLDAGAAGGLELPAIIEDEDGSPAVLFRAGRRGAVLANPRRGLRQLTPGELTALWRGEVLAVVHLPERPLGHLLRSNAAALASITAASLLIVLFGLVAPLSAKVVVDRVIVDGDTALLGLLGVGLLGLLVFRVAAGVLREQLLVHVTRRAVLLLQVRLLDHVLRLPLAAAQRVGDAAGLQSSERLVAAAVAVGLPLVVDTLALAIGVAAMFVLSPPLALVAVLFVITYTLATLALPPVWLRAPKPADAHTAARGYLIELVAGIETITSLASEHLCTARGTKLMLQAKSREQEMTRARDRRQVIGAALHFAALAAVLGYGAALTLAGQASAGDVVACLAIVSGLVGPVEALLEARGAADELRRRAASIAQVLQLQPEEPTGHGAAPHVAGHIRLTDVCFRYPGAQDDALADVNLEILPGQRVALVGRSGSGKTTLINLLIGMCPPTRGTIHVDGTDLAAIPKPALRRQLGIVEQHPFLFDGSIADTISRGDPSVTREGIVKAARLAGAHDFIMALPHGYDTPVGERGTRLSGGERQRLTIARALVGEPRLVVLDEATSALDSQTEHEVHQSLQHALAGRTMILIAHRLSTIRHADVIVVLDRGGIVEVGTDRELVARRGLYYYLTTRRV